MLYVLIHSKLKQRRLQKRINTKKMTKYCGCHNRNILVVLLAALVLASMMVNSQCRPIVSKEEEEDDDEGMESNRDENLGMKWGLEMSSRDEIVQVAGYGEEKLSTVLITGTLVCNKACLDSNKLQLSSQPISGALVGATCQGSKKDKRLSWAKAITDKYGEFIIDLPSHLHSNPNLDKLCSIKILQVPMDSACKRSDFVGKYTEIELASVGNGIRTYTTGRVEGMPENCMKEFKDEQEMALPW